MATIHPSSSEEFAEIAQQLLELAGHPRDVATSTDGPVALSLIVPDELYDRWQASQSTPKKGRSKAKGSSGEESAT